MNPVTDGLQPSLKLWGEEDIDGAVYAVYLKKVRYHHAKSDSSEQVSHLEWETIRIRMIKAGTIEKLVESLTTDLGDLESTYMNIFLSTYRSFAVPSQVLTILINRYEQMHCESSKVSLELRENHKRTIEKVLLVWLDMYSEDFFEPPQFLTLLKLKEFTRRFVPGSVLDLRAKHKLLKYKNSGNAENINNNPVVYTNGVHSGISPLQHWSILDISDREFALQLTYTDSELFKKLVPYQCLGSVWSHRDKLSGWKVSPLTVTATVNQFNAVSLRVISTVLSDSSLKAAMRARIIVKWINIAQELRLLKNFSSLKAITAALQSNSIHRLTKVWLCVPREKIESFLELAKIFSEENNQTNCRELLIKEGSAKFVNSVCFSKLFFKGSDKLPLEHAFTMQGTIPYLGTFLTDLTMIDAAISDYLPNGLINFDKKRKEFEILAQIKLLQSAANNYDIVVDPEFQAKFKAIPIFDEKESHELSCLIEPSDSSISNKKHVFENVKSSMFKWTHHKSGSSPASTSSGILCDKSSADANVIKENYMKVSKSCSNLSVSHHHSHSLSNGSSSPFQEFYIIKISLEQKNCDNDGVNMYKSIMLNNSDRTRTVITNAMLKHGIEGNPDDYILVQLVPGGEIVFPHSANVFYAVNRSHELKFILRARCKSKDIRGKKRIPL
ncbi:ral guanine nucleotide dissociation stimulator-like 1 [Parasteatoda tepidariorum]|uniref:ral guanine nucleotide dissociation stimulator-like 1 n=1 Tax=Parasteatoda tepidariorum TaxID=114398 RepID=UPI00077FDFEA|nr:ral guanine nucleotide dissociation stimulator-like 1 [Parasteatoda tepidariorum]XP_042911501.1 ral guanine nucleotide dissociation stimulator-like 1 [Parasteatoda tepidariorum]